MKYGIVELHDNYDFSTPVSYKELVRCKECKWEQRCQKAVQHTTHDLTSVTIGYKSVEFCSYGERKDNE